MVSVKISRLDPYPSDLSDKQWGLLVEKFPQLLDTENSRRILDGILYRFTTGVVWAAIPRDLPYPTDIESFYSITKSTGFLNEIITYLGSNYILPPILISRLKSRGFKLDFSPNRDYAVDYGMDGRLRR